MDVIYFKVVCDSFFIGYKEQSHVKIFKNFTSKLQPGDILDVHNRDTSEFRIDFSTPILLRNLGITNIKDTDDITICELKLIESGK